jgi:integrase
VAVANIDQAMVMKVLDPIWTTKTETASRVRGRIEAVLDWATVRGFRRGENPARWRGHLEKALPARTKVQRVQHHAAMAIDAIPGFMAQLRDRSGAGAQCLAFLILTASRYNEAAGARWGEIDLEKRVWTVPAERMKAGREHRVPLSDPTLEILRDRAKLRSGGKRETLVFGSDFRHDAQLSDMTLTAALRRLGRKETVHGFRSTFRDWAAERTSFPREIAEAALAHANADKVEAAYRRSDLFEKRRELMAAWALFCGDEIKGAILANV